MIKTKQSAVTAVSYGLIAALVAALSLGALTAAGVNIENVFSTTGNAIAATMTVQPSNPIGTPNSSLNSEQQSEITNAVSEIAAGTASAACLQSMNNAANASSMASNSATCLGLGYGIAPPPLPVEEQMIGGHNAEVMTNGNVYSVLIEAGYYSNMPSDDALSSAQNFNQQITAGNENMLIAYGDGYITSGSDYQLGALYNCYKPINDWRVNPPGGSVTSGTIAYSSYTYGVCADAVPTNYSYNGTATAANPLGTGAAW